MGRAGKLTEDGIGVTVNTVTPGYVSTEMVETIPEKVLDRIKGSIPHGPAGQAVGGRTSGALPSRGRLGVHRGTGLGESTVAWTCDLLRFGSPVDSKLAKSHRKG
jgi:NAD(P)-dependent dehydrogenase (short-subunit alcohol dehydrogenase family)